MRRTFPVQPGVPAAGHVTTGGAWHPGRAEGCGKCGPPPMALEKGDRIVHVFRNRRGAVLSTPRPDQVLVCFDSEPEHPVIVKLVELSRER